MPLAVFTQDKGFTLVEMLIVVAIIAVLAAISAPKYLGYRDQASIQTCVSNQDSLQTALEQFAFQTNSYPSSPDQTGMVTAQIVKSPIACPSSGIISWTGQGVVTCSIALHVRLDST